MINLITKNKKNRIINKLKEQEKIYKGQMNFHIKGLINDFESAIKYWDSRENIHYHTGIRINKIGKIIF